MGKAKAAGVGLGDRIERPQQARLVTAARQKLEVGETLNHREVAAPKKFEREQLDRYGPQYLATMPKGAYAQLSGRQPKQLIEAADRYGLPYRPNEKTVDVGRVLRWFHDFLAANAGLLTGSGDDEDQILHLASKELKDEYVRKRIDEKAVDIERKKHELAQLHENYLPIEPIRQTHNDLAELIRSMRMKLAKRFTGDDKEFVEQAFDDLISDYERTAEYRFNESGHDPDHEPAVGTSE